MPVNRILIVGLGSIGKRHVRLARELLPEVDIKVLRHQECTTIPKYTNGCFSNINEAVDFAPQLAVIAGPATFHMHTALPLAQAGVNLLIEKPLSATLEDINHLLEVCSEQKTVLLIGYNLRFLPSLQEFRRLVKKHVIGKVLSVRCEVGQYLPAWRPDTDYKKSVSAQSKFGGGALPELSHEIDYLRWIFGEVDWVKATLSRQSSLEIDVEDTAHLILGFSKTNDCKQLIGSVNLDFIRHDSTRICTAIGEEGSLRWNGMTDVVEIFDKGAKEWRELYQHTSQRDDSYSSEWKHILECINEHKTPLITGEDGLKVVQIIDAARQSSLLGSDIKIK